ncbi:YadA-like family protein [Enterobacter cloacae]|uniref:YadA-like family protein n=1 Tax=Enterobacter cloacae TaxID=550 RepID=UPI000B8D2F33|nr:YadA-like family protein [Enterobacter cloacae]ASQ15656.1 Adhesin YadA [Enterobacter cloacae]
MLKTRTLLKALAVVVLAQSSVKAEEHSKMYLYGTVDANKERSFMFGYNSLIFDETPPASNILFGFDSLSLLSPNTLIYGNSALVFDSPGGGVFGNEITSVSSAKSTVIGNESMMLLSENSVALGSSSIAAKANNSVALGHGSLVFNENNVVSVGAGNKEYAKAVDAPETRRIINVSDGVRATDAATVGQVVGATQAVQVYTDGRVQNVRNEVKSLGDNLRNVLGTTTKRLDNIQKQIKNNHKELRESAAQNAALAGLFQPYSVGRFNATAALGGYRDKQAVAVGVGYRFSDNLAGKVAVAAGGSSVSWNTGVNLEF